MADLRACFMLRHEAALASCKLTRGGTGGQPTHRKSLCLGRSAEPRDEEALFRTQATMEVPMKVTRCAVTVVVLALLAAPLAVQAQPAGKVWRIGGLMGTLGPESPRGTAFREGLRALGYVEGQNFAFEWRLSGCSPWIPSARGSWPASRGRAATSRGSAPRARTPKAKRCNSSRKPCPP